MKEVIIGEYQGVTVTATFLPSVRGHGPNRLWVNLKQKHNIHDLWEVRENLSYVHGVDILFRKKENVKKKFEDMNPKEQHSAIGGSASVTARRQKAYRK